MSFLNRILGRSTTDPDFTNPTQLRAVFDTYTDEWPDNNDTYRCWKPASLLPAPKQIVKQALKVRYAEWPEPIDWPVFSAFFMEFVDLGLHLAPNEYSKIEHFRAGRIMCAGQESKYDPLLTYIQTSNLVTAQTLDHLSDDILQIREGLRRTPSWDPIDTTDDELDEVRRILVESAVEYASLAIEWRFYILGIGRDSYVE